MSIYISRKGVYPNNECVQQSVRACPHCQSVGVRVLASCGIFVCQSEQATSRRTSEDLQFQFNWIRRTNVWIHRGGSFRFGPAPRLNTLCVSRSKTVCQKVPLSKSVFVSQVDGVSIGADQSCVLLHFDAVLCVPCPCLVEERAVTSEARFYKRITYARIRNSAMSPTYHAFAAFYERYKRFALDRRIELLSRGSKSRYKRTIFWNDRFSDVSGRGVKDRSNCLCGDFFSSDFCI